MSENINEIAGVEPSFKIDEGRTESTGGKQSHCASCQFKDAKF